MDAWSDRELKAMKLGGNKKFREFCEEQKFPPKLPQQKKYDNEPCRMYRDQMKRALNGKVNRLQSLSSVWDEDSITVPTSRLCEVSTFIALGLGVVINSIYMISLIN